MSLKSSILHRIKVNHTPKLSWVTLIIWMGIIFYFSHQPSLPGLPDGLADTILKKSAHAFAYAILMGLWWWALQPVSLPVNGTLAPALGLTLLYAVSDEWHQTFIPGRNGQLADVLVDSAGAVFAFIVLRRFLGRMSNGH
jgi:VanZ family protein